ncbi:hypothetical protein PR001_g29040 [Phytophthora rubi]|uniref:Uncharacterized protein n=1 Tax=Phytophthora rubi TaxID=129364 RepID=A0A6A3H5M9_9STRA|nr:hypothetical protein PR001_g29040 [Phytophthora rubi]
MSTHDVDVLVVMLDVSLNHGGVHEVRSYDDLSRTSSLEESNGARSDDVFATDDIAAGRCVSDSPVWAPSSIVTIRFPAKPALVWPTLPFPSTANLASQAFEHAV